MTIELPLTRHPNHAIQVWSQYEYIAATQQGFRFTAHKDWWHWSDSNACYSMRIRNWKPVQPIITHTFPVTLDWINDCMKACAKLDV